MKERSRKSCARTKISLSAGSYVARSFGSDMMGLADFGGYLHGAALLHDYAEGLSKRHLNRLLPIVKGDKGVIDNAM